MNKNALRIKKPIVLCGFMGSGKSGLGFIVASELKLPFYDLDKLIESKYDKDITTLFAEYGENWFRATELKELMEFLAEKKNTKELFILSLGGGSLHNYDVVNTINAKFDLWFIEVAFDELLERIMKRTTRPLLLDKTGKMKPKKLLYEELKALYSSRLPLYELSGNRFKSNSSYSKEENAEHLLASIISKQIEEK